MSSVTLRIKTVSQPKGGYIKPRNMSTKELGKGIEELNQEENIPANLIGMAVDYLTRFMSGASVEKSFQISMMGTKIKNQEKKAKKTHGRY